MRKDDNVKLTESNWKITVDAAPLTINSNQPFGQRLLNLVTNPFRYLFTGKYQL